MAGTITRRLVSLADAADTLALSTRTVRRYIADGQLEAVRLGRKTLRIKVDSIERFIDARPVGVSTGSPAAQVGLKTKTGAAKPGRSLFPVCSPFHIRFQKGVALEGLHAARGTAPLR